MFGRIFGRDKDDQDQAVCAECGRTLLAGEWTQTIVGPGGEEQTICSLCGQSRDFGDEAPAAVPAPANNGRVRETRTEAQAEGPHDARGESDAFWKALKDKDAEIERLQEQLARSEAEKQELAGRLARMDASDDDGGAYAPGVDSMAASALPAAPLISASGPVVNELTGDSSEPGERTWGETPAEFAAELAALREETAPAQAATDEADAADEREAAEGSDLVAAAAVDEAETAAADEPLDVRPAEPLVTQAAELAGQTPPAVVFEDTQEISAEEAAAAQPGLLGDAETTLAPEEGLPAAQEPAPAEPSADALEAQAGSLTLLQRGVDLLNVSRVPRKIAETNEQLGLPSVHVGFDGQTVAVTFMWTMGWYRFHVDIDSGDVRMDERGYEELSHLQPNAAVRADGTVQLAPAQISRAAAQRPPERQPEPAAPAEEREPAEPETPRVAAQKPPEILSKSLLGQRSDDEAASWEQTQARDFDWDR